MIDDPFETLAHRYDAWFDGPRGRSIFAVEVLALRELLTDLPRPWLEVGVGTGRFAEALGVDEGIDPSAAVREIAAARGVAASPGRAESLPCPDSAYGALLLVVTLCFLEDPRLAMRESARVLRESGRLLVGLVPRDSPWGRLYARQGRQGHPFYSKAAFYTCEEVVGLAAGEGFWLEDSRSCLFESPETDVSAYREPRAGLAPGAGFVAMRFALGGAPSFP